jgi:hypothetical protein
MEALRRLAAGVELLICSSQEINRCYPNRPAVRAIYIKDLAGTTVEDSKLRGTVRGTKDAWEKPGGPENRTRSRYIGRDGWPKKSQALTSGSLNDTVTAQQAPGRPCPRRTRRFVERSRRLGEIAGAALRSEGRQQSYDACETLGFSPTGGVRGNRPKDLWCSEDKANRVT